MNTLTQVSNSHAVATSAAHAIFPLTTGRGPISHVRFCRENGAMVTYSVELTHGELEFLRILADGAVEVFNRLTKNFEFSGISATPR